MNGRDKGLSTLIKGQDVKTLGSESLDPDTYYVFVYPFYPQ